MKTFEVDYITFMERFNKVYAEDKRIKVQHAMLIKSIELFFTDVINKVYFHVSLTKKSDSKDLQYFLEQYGTPVIMEEPENVDTSEIFEFNPSN